jgi:uncharacterized protein DUF3187
MRRSSFLAVFVAATLGTAAHAQDFPTFPDHSDEESLWFREPNVGYGPVHYVSMSLFPSLRSGFETNFPESMPAGTFDLRITESWVKNSSASDLWQIDYEVLRSNVGFSWGLSDDVRLDLTIESASRTGGTLDAFILGFHQTFGVAVGYRNNFARNENRIEIQPPNGGAPIVVDKHDPQPYEQAALLTLRDTLTYGDEDVPAIAWSLSVRGSLAPGDIRRSGPFDLGASLGMVKEFDSVHVYVGGNVAWYGREEFFGLKLKPIQWSTTVAVEWHAATDFSLIVQYLVTSGAAERLSDFSLPCHEIVAGFKGEPWPGVILEAAIVENIINFKNSPDFGVHLGITFRW